MSSAMKDNKHPTGARATGGAWDMYICGFTQKWIFKRIAKSEGEKL